MAKRIWVGGTTGVSQIDTVQLSGTWAGDGAITTTLTAEDGSTIQTVATTTAGTTTAARDAHVTALQSSTNSLFVKITWASSSTDSFTGTAKVAGVPFYQATTEADSTGTVASDSSTTGNAGPNDWNTTGNWEGGVVPITGDQVYVAGGGYSIWYGLDQSAVALNSFHVGRNYTGQIGDPINGYYLQIDVNNASPTTAWFNSGGTGGILISGTIPTAYVQGGAAGPNMLKMDGSVTDLIVTGPNVQGDITLAASMTATNVYMLRADAARLVVNASITIAVIEMNSGIVELYANVTDGAYLSGGRMIIYDDGKISGGTNGLELRHGIVEYWSGETLAKLTMYGGRFDLSKNTEDAVIITSAVQWDGVIDERSGLDNVTWSSLTTKGGEILLESGTAPTL